MPTLKMEPDGDRFDLLVVEMGAILRRDLWNSLGWILKNTAKKFGKTKIKTTFAK